MDSVSKIGLGLRRLSHITSHQYGQVGNRTLSTVDAARTATIYDVRNRPIEVRRLVQSGVPLEQVFKTSFDRVGNAIATTDPLSTKHGEV
jgi:hypothetical protein